MKWIYLSLAIVTEVIATSALKASAGFTNVMPSIIVVVGYVISFYCLSLTLNIMPIGIAYAIWSGIGIVLISFISWFLYKQHLDIPAIIGIFFIILGVLIINLFSNSVSH